MGRGDLISVIVPGTYGKPRPAVVIQSDLFDEHPSIVILPVTSTLRDTPLFRIRIEPSPENGLQSVSEIMIDKITTIPRKKAGPVFGHLEDRYMISIERLVPVFLGIA
ncbi:MAG: type II toxin-antitoxin system PemK/MazF family toxin [Thermodesulfobacteriota bacterium]